MLHSLLPVASRTVGESMVILEVRFGMAPLRPIAQECFGTSGSPRLPSGALENRYMPCPAYCRYAQPFTGFTSRPKPSTFTARRNEIGYCLRPSPGAPAGVGSNPRVAVKPDS